MSLYLCIFDGEEEIEGVEVGPYADFNGLRSYVVMELEGGRAGAKYPTFIMHSDSEGMWSAPESKKLDSELSEIISAMKVRQPVPFVSEWQAKVANAVGLLPKNAFESFVDVDGEFVLGRIHTLVTISVKKQLPILFQ